MKNTILIFALFMFAFGLTAQTVEYGKEESLSILKNTKEKKDLSKFELQLNRDGLLPSVSANIYLKENTLLRVSSPSLSYRNMRGLISGDDIELNTFLEFRKYKTDRLFISHGPAIGFSSERYSSIEGPVRENEARVGYNFGGGVRLSNHFTGGTYINPYVSFGDNGISLRHGRLFAGAIGNIYLAYRF